MKLILGKGFVVASAGVLAGVFFSIYSTSLMTSLLYGVHPHDPVVFLTVPALLLIVALLASYIPARRAAQVDPMIALHET